MKERAINFLRSLSSVGRRRAFRRFWMGMMVSRTGDVFSAVAITWLVLDLAGPAQLGIVFLCMGLPRTITGPIAGRLLDRWDPRLVIALDNAGRAVLIVCLAALAWLGSARMWRLDIAWIYVLAVLSALLSSATEVAEGTIVPRLVADSELESANSLLSANWELAYIVGPPMSGVAVQLLGAPLSLVIDGGSFVAMSLIALSLPALHQRRETHEEHGVEPRRRDWTLGFALLLGLRAATVLTVMRVLVFVVHGASEVVYPVYGRVQLRTGAFGYGLLLGSGAAGALIGLLFAAPIARRLSPGMRLGLVIVGGAVFIAGLSMTTSVAVACVIGFLAGLAMGPYYSLERSLFQRAVPSDLLGRVTGARAAIASAGFPLGNAVGGLMLSSFSATTAVLSVACGFGIIGLSAMVSPALRDEACRPAVADPPAD